MEKAGGGGGGGGRGQNNKEYEESETYSSIEKTDNMIALVVGTRNGDNYIKAGEIGLAINKSGETGSYESTAYINANHVNISATNTAYTLAGDMEHDANGRLVIKNAGGMYVRRTEQGVTAEFGVFDNGNLTGGIVVSKINGEASAYINAAHVNISATSTAHTLAGDLEHDSQGRLVIKNASGLYVSRNSSLLGVWDQGNLTGSVMVQQINGQSSVTISADRIDINGIVTALDTYDIQCESITCTTESNFDGGIYTTDISGANAIFDAGTFADLTCTDLTVDGNAATWKSFTHHSFNVSTERPFLYGSTSAASGTVTGYVLISHSTSTINYLGR
jgi:hypothetical protein